MRSIHIPCVSFNKDFTVADNVIEVSRQLTPVTLEEVPWPAYPYKPDVKFSIAHTGTHLLLSYQVEEAEVRHVNTVINSSVWEDSCVEFFISFDEEGYYNFEFNCIGTALVGFGKDKTNRKLLPVPLIQQIKCFTQMEKKANSVEWQMQAVIPLSAFMHHSLLNLTGRKCKANFYKCGDKLLQPHFLAWNRIETAEPDFHQPAFFGDIEFEAKVS